MTEDEIIKICVSCIDAEINAYTTKAAYTVICWRRNRVTKELTYDVPMPYNHP